MTIADDIAAVVVRIAHITGTTDSSAWNAVLHEAASQDVAPVSVSVRNASFAVAPAAIDGLVRTSAARWHLDPALLTAIIANESGFDAGATSRAGAQGLMQLMPSTASALGVRDSYDPAQSIAVGARYLRSMLDRFGGNERLAVAAYNAGPGAVANYGAVPPYAETQRYVAAVLAARDAYRRR